MQITDGTIILRDFTEKDIESRIRWETEETEWQLWDGPWEYEGLSAEQKKKELDKYVQRLHKKANDAAAKADNEMRNGFEICTFDGRYIGWCNSYFIDDDCVYSKIGSRRAVGIDIPETVERGKHYGFRTLCLFIDYLTANGCHEIYTQTWS